MIDNTKFKSTFEYKVIYVFRINDGSHDGCLKIGDATIYTQKSHDELKPNSKELNYAARNRIDSYTSTAGVVYDLLYTEIAVYISNNKLKAFRDHKVHKVLKRSGIKSKYFATNKKQNEWFITDLETAKNAIKAVKEGKSALNSSDISTGMTPIIFRPEQNEAIKKTISRFRKDTKMLWNAKMRFGKTLSALQVAKEMEFKKTIIITHRPVVSEGWFEDFNKIFYDKKDYHFGSKNKGKTINDLLKTNENFVYFASMQDLRGSEIVGGNFNKNDKIFNTNWDFVVVDEAHEGTKTELGSNVLREIIKEEQEHKTYVLQLSGTPFNLLTDFEEESIYTWDYIMEQEAKVLWDQYHFGDSNPYEELPKMNIFTYHLEKSLPVYIDVEDKAFNFREFFRTWTGDIQKDFKRIPSTSKIGDFVHEEDIIAFLDLITREDENTNYPFSTEQYREFFRHSLWVVPGVKEAKALSEILNKHRIFKNFHIVNVAGDGDEEIDTSDALFAVKNAMTDEPNLTYTITITCGRLTTGVSVPEWTAVLMLAGTYSTSASQYLQTIFRVQTPANINGKIKNECYVFDFAPDRTLKMVAESVQLSAKAGVKNITAEMSLKKFLNYCPVISISESTMTIYKVSELLQELKKAYAERVAKNGFDDPKIYNDELLMLTEVELKDFEELKKIVGNSKQTKRTGIIDINNQGFNEEELEEEQELKRKPKKELTEEEKARLHELKDKRKNRDTAISILRAISIRMPLLVYGMDHDISVDIAIENFADAIDDLSWEEFMPSGVTKEIFKQFSKYYDKDIFVAASRRIRYISKSADELEPIERVNKIASLFSTFKNPDKETVLTPWKVVNMHLGRTIGGSNFYDENYSYMIQDPREIEIEGVTKKIFNEDSKILEINSKTGLYPLYMAFSFYNKKISELNEESLSFEEKNNIWDDIIKKKIFVICKTPMAKLITKRTLLGYRKGKTNMHAFDDLVMQLKDKPDKFVEKITKGRFWNLGGIKNMKFNAIVGNPPYQVQKGGTKNIDIWQHFVTVGAKTGKHSSFIHPGRWVIPKKQMVSVSNNIMSSGLKHFDYYPNSLSFFEGVDIDGGITITFFEKNYEGDIFYSINGIEKGIFTQNERIFINEYEEEIYEKIIKKYNGETFMDRRIFGNIGSLGGSEFGYQKTTMIKLLKDSPQGLEDPIKIWANSGHGKGTRFSWHYIDNKHVTPPAEIMKTRKVMIDKKGHAITKGRGNVINNKPQILDKKTIASGDVLFVIPEIDDSNHLKFIKNMFLSKTIRFLMTLTQKDLYVRGFENIPDYKWFMEVFKDETLNDTNLYKKFNFSRELIEHIERSVSEK